MASHSSLQLSTEQPLPNVTLQAAVRQDWESRTFATATTRHVQKLTAWLAHCDQQVHERIAQAEAQLVQLERQLTFMEGRMMTQTTTANALIDTPIE